MISKSLKYDFAKTQNTTVLTKWLGPGNSDAFKPTGSPKPRKDLRTPAEEKYKQNKLQNKENLAKWF